MRPSVWLVIAISGCLVAEARAGVDGNVDGMVDAFAFAVWRNHFGAVAEVGFGEQAPFEGAAVPEPASVASVILVILALSGVRLAKVSKRRVCCLTAHLLPYR